MKYKDGDRVYISIKNSVGPRKYLTGTITEIYKGDMGISMAGVCLDDGISFHNVIHVSIDALKRIENENNTR